MRVWVVAESGPGGPSLPMLELVGGARELGQVVDLFTWGCEEAVGTTAGGLGVYGIARTYSVGDPSPGLPAPAVAAGMARIIAGGDVPEVVLIGANYDGRDVAGRLSVKLDRPVITNVSGLTLGSEGTFIASHAIFGGTHTATSRFTGPGPAIFVVRDHTFEPAIPDAGPGDSSAELVAVGVADLGRTGAAKVVARHVVAQVGPRLDEAAVVVSGGRGLGGPEHYGLVKDLARLLHGAAGASRAIVDAGWVPYAHQVGQTGKTVRPTVYVACGISGATQHMVGMKGASHVVAINTDRDAPIFDIADLGVVGDCQAVLPRLIEALEARLGASPETR